MSQTELNEFMAQTHHFIINEDFQNAENMFKNLLLTNYPNEAIVHEGYGKFLYDQHRKDEAFDAFSKALDLKADNPDVIEKLKQLKLEFIEEENAKKRDQENKRMEIQAQMNQKKQQIEQQKPQLIVIQGQLSDDELKQYANASLYILVSYIFAQLPDSKYVNSVTVGKAMLQQFLGEQYQNIEILQLIQNYLSHIELIDNHIGQLIHEQQNDNYLLFQEIVKLSSNISHERQINIRARCNQEILHFGNYRKVIDQLRKFASQYALFNTQIAFCALKDSLKLIGIMNLSLKRRRPNNVIAFIRRRLIYLI